QASAKLRFVMVNGLCPATDLSKFNLPVLMTWSMPHQLPSVIQICQNGQSKVVFEDEVEIVNAKGAILPKNVIGQLRVAGHNSFIKAELGSGEAQDELTLHGFIDNNHQQLNPWHNGCWVDCDNIQQTLLQQPGVTDALVFNRADQQGISRLVAYLVCDRVLSMPALIKKLSEHTGANEEPRVNEVPFAFGFVNQLPLTAQGKIHFAKLQSISLFEHALLDGQLDNDLSNSAPIQLPILQRKPQQADEPFSTTPALVTGQPLDIDSLPPSLSQLLVNAAKTDHGITHILNSNGDTQYVSYAELLTQAKIVGQGLLNAGLHSGDRVMLQVSNNTDILSAFWGCVVAGLVPLPVTRPVRYELDDKDCHKVVSSCDNLQLNAVICDNDNHAVLTDLIGNSQILRLGDLQTHQPMNEVYQAERESTALLLLTSGSTGLPKAVQQCHRALISRSAAMAITGQFSVDTISFNWMPLDHVGGIVMYHMLDVYLGARQIHCPTEIILQQPTLWLDWLSQYKVNSTWAPNFAYALVNEQIDEQLEQTAGDWDLSSIQFMLNGGEAIVEKTARNFLSGLARYGLNPQVMYPSWGMSETCSGVTVNTAFDPLNTPSQHDYVTVGNPVPGVSIRTVDGNGNVTNEGQVGQLQLNGPTVTLGYL
ncbi:MAG: AMP-binding protein, partial [Algicola sp.]|nr:AMP-binding protein [Algicola sp.]